MRPLIREAGSTDKMSDISRRHTLVEGSGGLLTITGGKLTTYRRMAKDVDAALHQIIQAAGGKSAEEAAAYVAALNKDKRYQRDIY